MSLAEKTTIAPGGCRRVARSICRFAPDTLDCGMVEIADLPHFNQDHEYDLPEASVCFRQAGGVSGSRVHIRS